MWNNPKLASVAGESFQQPVKCNWSPKRTGIWDAVQIQGEPVPRGRKDTMEVTSVIVTRERCRELNPLALQTGRI